MAVISQDVTNRAVDAVSSALFIVMLVFDKNMEGARIDNRTSALHATDVLVPRGCDLFQAMLQYNFAPDDPLAICCPAHGLIRLAILIKQSEYPCSEIGQTVSCVQQRIYLGLGGTR